MAGRLPAVVVDCGTGYAPSIPLPSSKLPKIPNPIKIIINIKKTP
jgi:hypothetical protein